MAQTASSFIAGTKAPTLTINSVTSRSTSITVNAESTVPGHCYFVVTEVTTGAVAPTIAQIKAGQDSTGAPAPSTNSTIGVVPSNFSLTGLVSDKEYIVYGFTSGNGKDSVPVYQSFTSPKPDATLSSLICTYTPSGGGILNRNVPINDAMYINVPADATDINNVIIKASAPSDVTIEFSGDTTAGPVLNSLTQTIDMSSLEISSKFTISIKTSGTPYKDKTYTLTLTKVAGS